MMSIAIYDFVALAANVNNAKKILPFLDYQRTTALSALPLVEWIEWNVLGLGWMGGRVQMRIFLVLPMDLSLPSSICRNSSQSWILKGTLWIPDSRPLSVDSGFPFVIHFLSRWANFGRHLTKAITSLLDFFKEEYAFN